MGWGDLAQSRAWRVFFIVVRRAAIGDMYLSSWLLTRAVLSVSWRVLFLRVLMVISRVTCTAIPITADFWVMLFLLTPVSTPVCHCFFSRRRCAAAQGSARGCPEGVVLGWGGFARVYLPTQAQGQHTVSLR